MVKVCEGGNVVSGVYNVWVGGVLDTEGVDYFTAVEVADDWLAQDYDDVVIELSQEDN